jgi:hypothetical protein
MKKGTKSRHYEWNGRYLTSFGMKKGEFGMKKGSSVWKREQNHVITSGMVDTSLRSV